MEFFRSLVPTHNSNLEPPVRMKLWHTLNIS